MIRRNNRPGPKPPNFDQPDNEVNTIPNPVDLLMKVRSLIGAIRASSQRQANFYNIVEHELGAESEIKLLLDVKTRRYSTYQMLIQLRLFKQVNTSLSVCFSGLLLLLTFYYQPLDIFLSLDSSKNIAKFKLSDEEWVCIDGIVENLEMIIEVISPNLLLATVSGLLCFRLIRVIAVT
jgi:hypothetical protein